MSLSRWMFHGTSDSMTVPHRTRRPEIAPALFKLLCDSSLSRSALDCCGVPVAILEAAATKPVVRYANAAFDAFFGYAPGETFGQGLAMLVFRRDEALVRRLVEEQRRWEVTAWRKDGAERTVAVTVARVRAVDGTLTHWVLTFSDLSEVEGLRAEVLSLKASAETRVRLNTGSSRALSAEPVHDEGLPRPLFGHR